MNTLPKKPTVALIEAALSAFAREDLAPRPNGELSQPMSLFFSLVEASDELKGSLMGIAGSLISDLNADFDQAEFDRLVREGEMKPGYLLKVLAACNTFFWVGWYARGAAEDEEALKRLHGGDGGR